MRLKDLNTLPKVRDSFSYLYVEHCNIEQDAKAIAFFDKDGKTSVRVRTSYSQASAATGVGWTRRQYNRADWKDSTPINRALSAANSCLYGVCQAAIVSAGYSTALGFIHTGKMQDFLY